MLSNFESKIDFSLECIFMLFYAQVETNCPITIIYLHQWESNTHAHTHTHKKVHQRIIKIIASLGFGQKVSEYDRKYYNKKKLILQFPVKTNWDKSSFVKVNVGFFLELPRIQSTRY